MPKIVSPTTKVNNQTAWEIYTPEEKDFYKKEMILLSQMRDQFRTPLIEFDDKTFLAAYEEDRKADLGYNFQVDDANDFRMTSGLTREKDTTILSTLLNLSLKLDLTAFDKDNGIIAELGEEMEDLVKKSYEIENYKEKKQDIYRELIAHGEVYVEEVYKEVKILSKYDTNWSPKDKIADFKGDVMPIYDIEGTCEVKLHLGKYVLYTSMNDPELQNNSAVATYEEIDRSMAESIYGDWDRWDLVPEEVNNELPFKVDSVPNSGSDYSWNTFKVGKGKVGITKIMHRFSNKMMILLNGVMMLPIEFPLTKISPSGLYPIAKGICERIPNFSKGKGYPAKTRVDQKMYDTLLRAMVGKAWQSYRPALGSKSGNVLSRDIVVANQITHGIKPGDIFPILPAQLLSVTSSDVQMFELVKSVISEKTVTDSFEGQIVGDPTATQVISQQKQTMLKLGASIDGVKGLEKRMNLLRIYNIIANWTTSTDNPLAEEAMEIQDGIATITGKTISPTNTTKKFKRYSVNTTLPDGKKGTKFTQFVGNDTPLPSPREQVNSEEDMSKEYGQPVRISYLNAEWLRLVEAIWDVNIIVSSETDDHMDLLMFIDNLTRVSKLFGVQIFKQDYALQQIAIKMDQDYEKLFNASDPNALAGALQNINPGGTPGGTPAATQVKNPAQQIVNSSKPSPLSVAKIS